MLRAFGSALGCGLLLTMCSSGQPDAQPPASAVPSLAPAPPKAPSPAPHPSFPGKASKEWIVSPRGVGPVQFGMSVADARRALGDVLSSVPADGGCVLIEPAGAPAGLTLMIENGRVVRADVDSETVATDHGAMVGMSGLVIRELYGDSVVFTPHKYDPRAQYITFAPKGPGESQFRVVFETRGRVLRFHAGVLPAAAYVERCG